MAIDKKPKFKLPKITTKKGAGEHYPETEDEWVRYVNRAHDEGLETRAKYEFQWVVNLSYYLGVQHLLFNPKTNLLQVPREHIQPLTVNRVGSFIESRHAKLTKNRPQARVIPDTTDHDDLRAAKFSDQLLKHLWRKIKFENEYSKTVMYMLISGVSFVKTIWDPLNGDFIEEEKKKPNTLMSFDENLEPEIEKIFLGEVYSRALSPFAIIPANESIDTVKDQPWVLERVHVPVIELELMYPHLKGMIKKEEYDVSRTEYEKIITRLGAPLFTTGVSRLSEHGDALNRDALTKTMWIKPNHLFERGLTVVVIGDKLARLGPFPNDYGQNVYPFVKFAEKETGYHFFTQSTIERLIPIQREINRLKQQKSRNAALMANIKWLLAKGSGVHEDSLNDEEGEVVEYNSAVPEPKAAQIAPLPNYVVQSGEELIRDFRDAGGQRESTVTPPSNLTAAVALQVSAEQAEEIIGPILRRMSESLSLVANTQLELANQEWLEPRKIKIIGDNGKTGVEYISKLNLRHHTDVHIEVESMFPDLRGAKLERVFNLWDRRIIDDPQVVIKAIRFGTFDQIIDDLENKEDKIKNDIELLKNGATPVIHPFQDHAGYVAALSRFINTPEFDRLIPKRKELMLQTLAGHMQFLMPQGPRVEDQNPASVNTPSGSQRPVGAPGGT